MNTQSYVERKDVSADEEAERRIAPRVKTLKRGKVYFNNMSSTFDCVVRNISATGALLTLDETAHLPREFDVKIGEERGLRLARLVYRRGPLAGIHFANVVSMVEDVAAPSAALPAMREVAAAEAFPMIRKVSAERLPIALTRNFRWL